MGRAKTQAPAAPLAAQEPVRDAEQGAEQLTETPEAASAQKECAGMGEPLAFEGYRVAFCSALNLRKEPDRAAEVVAVLPHGTPVTLTGRWVADSTAVWMPVEADGAAGWVDARFLAFTCGDFGHGED